LVRGVLTVGLAVVGGTHLRAQDRPVVTVEGGALWSAQRSTDVDTGEPSIPRPGVGGTAFGIVAAASVGFGPVVDGAVELSLPARFESIQTAGYQATQFVNAHRDTIVSALVRFHPKRTPNRRLAVDGVVGASWIWEDTNVQLPAGRTTHVARGTEGLSGGVNIDVPVAPRISIVPEFRLHFVPRETSVITPSGQLGLDFIVWRAAVAVRAFF